MADAVVEARNLGKIFGEGAEQVEALHDINLSVAPGEFLSLIGPSGCGKSTLLGLIGDLTSPTSGELLINGKSPHQARLDRDYGIVFQQATLLDWRTVGKNVELPLAEWIADGDNEDIAQPFLTASFRGWIHCLDNFQQCVDIVLDNGSTLGSSHQAWQLNEIIGLIFPATNDIGVMNESLWDQTVEVATGQIAEMEGVTVSSDAFRTDIAEAAVAVLESAGLDVDGSSYQRRTITLHPGGE